MLVASQAISGASNDELIETAAAIEGELTRRALAARDSGGRHGEVIEERPAAGGTYRLEKVRCGKLNCRCAAGKLHGPYWYLYQRRGGKLTSKYVGKRLPGGGDATEAGGEG